MDIDRVLIRNKAKEIIEEDFKDMEKITTKLQTTAKDYTKERLDAVMNQDFKIFVGDEAQLRLEITRGQLVFLKNFIVTNVDNRFHFNIRYDNKDTILFIDKDSINEDNLEHLVQLMYLHTLI